MAATASAHGVSGAVASGHVKNDAMTTTAAIPTGAISAPGQRPSGDAIDEQTATHAQDERDDREQDPAVQEHQCDDGVRGSGLKRRVTLS